MATIEMKVFVVDTLPVSGIVPHALYLFKAPEAEHGQLYKANAAGTSLVMFTDSVNTKKTIIHKGDLPPAEGSNTPLWYDTEDLVLYVNIPVDGEDNWVEAIAVPAMPDFAGTGTADTMSRSDHHHVGAYVENPVW